MPGPLTVRLDEELEAALDRYCQESGRNRSDVVREALRRKLTLLRFEEVRERILPFATRGLSADVFRLVLAENELIVGQIVLEELRRVPDHEIGLPETALEEAGALLEEHPVVPTVDEDPGVEIADRSDDRMLATALEAGAEMLVTGDRDLLSVKDRVQDLRIRDPRGFWEELR